MPNPKIDMAGKRIGKLTVIKYYETRNKQAYWLCKCDCGNEIIARGNHLRRGNIKSCGCLRHRPTIVKHNLSRSPIYDVYRGMIKRCTLASNSSYLHYGGRGISVCEEWADKSTGFLVFKNWAFKNGYKDGLSIERIDVNGNYCPDNCTWATPKEQANNRTNTPRITYKGETHTPAEWENICHIPRQTILNRYKKGWSIEKVFDNSYWSKKEGDNHAKG